jgi:hypothetical protein
MKTFSDARELARDCTWIRSIGETLGQAYRHCTGHQSRTSESCVGLTGGKATHTGVEDAVAEVLDELELVELEPVVEDELVVLELELDEDEVEMVVDVELVVEDELVLLVELVEDEVEVVDVVEDDEELEHVP